MCGTTRIREKNVRGKGNPIEKNVRGKGNPIEILEKTSQSADHPRDLRKKEILLKNVRGKGNPIEKCAGQRKSY